MPLFPVQDVSDPNTEDIFLKFEAFNADGRCVITIIASIKPWCHEWRAYWMAFTVIQGGGALADAGESARFERCKTRGNKLDEDVARAMFPEVERRYGVTWRA